jgi:RNA polymerase sigma-70 factor (ECF subfamily)
VAEATFTQLKDSAASTRSAMLGRSHRWPIEPHPAMPGPALRQPEPDEEALIAGCRRGERAAWHVLFQRYAPAVQRFIRALGVPDDEREDAAQDVFLLIYNHLRHFRGEAQLSSWIYRIAARHAILRARRRAARRLLQTLALREPPRPPSDPTARMSRVHQLDRMLSQLNAKKRTVFVLAEIEGLPIEEIARIVDCPVNTVWSRLHHARAEMLKMGRRMLV